MKGRLRPPAEIARQLWRLEFPWLQCPFCRPPLATRWGVVLNDLRRASENLLVPAQYPSMMILTVCWSGGPSIEVFLWDPALLGRFSSWDAYPTNPTPGMRKRPKGRSGIGNLRSLRFCSGLPWARVPHHPQVYQRNTEPGLVTLSAELQCPCADGRLQSSRRLFSPNQQKRFNFSDETASRPTL
ncbi:hypothetical protein IQ07DRAFT_282039 [Pyrenochaeta sp. DS3sAY3a]|nr:hypothetical protein IQ07DRAFT_282039 [Pyrenochaeta sp. DS3sAY3a]